MSDLLPDWVIVNAAGLYRTAHGSWSPHRQDAASFDSDVDARSWGGAMGANTGVSIKRKPYDPDAERSQQNLPAVPLDTSRHRSDYDPHGEAA